MSIVLHHHNCFVSSVVLVVLVVVLGVVDFVDTAFEIGTVAALVVVGVVVA